MHRQSDGIQIRNMESPLRGISGKPWLYKIFLIQACPDIPRYISAYLRINTGYLPLGLAATVRISALYIDFFFILFSLLFYLTIDFWFILTYDTIHSNVYLLLIIYFMHLFIVN